MLFNKNDNSQESAQVSQLFQNQRFNIKNQKLDQSSNITQKKNGNSLQLSKNSAFKKIQKEQKNVHNNKIEDQVNAQTNKTNQDFQKNCLKSENEEMKSENDIVDQEKELSEQNKSNDYNRIKEMRDILFNQYCLTNPLLMSKRLDNPDFKTVQNTRESQNYNNSEQIDSEISNQAKIETKQNKPNLISKILLINLMHQNSIIQNNYQSKNFQKSKIKDQLEDKKLLNQSILMQNNNQLLLNFFQNNLQNNKKELNKNKQDLNDQNIDQKTENFSSQNKEDKTQAQDISKQLTPPLLSFVSKIGFGFNSFCKNKNLLDMRNSMDAQEFKIPFQQMRDRALSSNILVQKQNIGLIQTSNNSSSETQEFQDSLENKRKNSESHSSNRQRSGSSISQEERRNKILKYWEKKKQRMNINHVRYHCRKDLADNRFRYHGRFISQEQMQKIIELEGSINQIYDPVNKNILKSKQIFKVEKHYRSTSSCSSNCLSKNFKNQGEIHEDALDKESNIQQFENMQKQFQNLDSEINQKFFNQLKQDQNQANDSSFFNTNAFDQKNQNLKTNENNINGISENTMSHKYQNTDYLIKRLNIDHEF